MPAPLPRRDLLEVLEDDLAALIPDDANGFAVDVLVGTAPSQIALRGIFDAETKEGPGERGAAVELRSRDVDDHSITHNTTITVDSVAYTVVGVEPDEAGIRGSSRVLLRVP